MGSGVVSSDAAIGEQQGRQPQEAVAYAPAVHWSSIVSAFSRSFQSDFTTKGRLLTVYLIWGPVHLQLEHHASH